MSRFSRGLDRALFVIFGLLLGLILSLGGGWLAGLFIGKLIWMFPTLMNGLFNVLGVAVGVLLAIWGINITGATAAGAVAAHLKAKRARDGSGQNG